MIISPHMLAVLHVLTVSTMRQICESYTGVVTEVYKPPHEKKCPTVNSMKENLFSLIYL